MFFCMESMWLYLFINDKFDHLYSHLLFALDKLYLSREHKKLIDNKLSHICVKYRPIKNHIMLF